MSDKDYEQGQKDGARNVFREPAPQGGVHIIRHVFESDKKFDHDTARNKSYNKGWSNGWKQR